MSWRSYLAAINLFSYPKGPRPRIVVTESNGRRHLFVDGAPQSSNHYLSNWRALLRARIFGQLPQDSRVLILGLGAGQLASVITRKYPLWHLTFVEIDKVVIRVAKDFFGITPSPNLAIVHADAQDFLHINRTLYNLIIVDLYSGDSVPTFVESSRFLQDLHRSLNHGGYVIFNYASHDFDTSRFTLFVARLRQFFAKVVERKIWGHMYYLASV